MVALAEEKAAKTAKNAAEGGTDAAEAGDKRVLRQRAPKKADEEQTLEAI